MVENLGSTYIFCLFSCLELLCSSFSSFSSSSSSSSSPSPSPSSSFFSSFLPKMVKWVTVGKAVTMRVQGLEKREGGYRF